MHHARRRASLPPLGTWRMPGCIGLAVVLVGCTLNGSGRDEAEGRRAGIGLTPAGFELLDPALLDLSGATTRTAAAAVLEQRFAPASAGEGAFDERTDLLTDPAGGSTAVYTASGLADDSVQAEQVVVEFEVADGGGFEVTGLGRRWRCWRGGDADDGWTTEPCP